MSVSLDDEDQVLDLYHRTSREAAESILREGVFRTRENTPEVFVSNRAQGYADEYGDVVVHVRIPESMASLEDEFEDGEEHYRIPLDQAEVVAAFTMDELGNQTPVGIVTEDQTLADTGAVGAVMVDQVGGDGVDVEVVDSDGAVVSVGEVSEEELQAAFETDDPAAALVASGLAADLDQAVDAVEQRLDWIASAETSSVQAATADELVESGTLERVEGLRTSMGVSRSQMTPEEVSRADLRAEIPATDRAESLRREIIDNPAVGAAYEEPREIRNLRELPAATLVAGAVQQGTMPTTN